MPQMQNVSSRYGALMGRSERHGPKGLAYKTQLFRVRLDAGGYDDGGAYWGTGEPLYCAHGEFIGESSAEDREFREFFRAADRDAAKQKVLAQYPNARFYR